MEPFEKTWLWEEGAVGFDPAKSPLQENPYFVFIPSEYTKEVRGTVIVAHGGGFSWRTGCEGVNVAQFFHEKGFNCAILSYRLLPYSRLDAIDDMKRTIRILKSRRKEWNLGEKICAMGFSAGGMLSANCATLADLGKPESEDEIERFSSKLDAAVIGYGAMSSVSFPGRFGMPAEDTLMGRDAAERYYLAPEKHVNPDTPPMFIWQTMSDDGRHGMCLAKALQDAGVAYELHIFQQGVHGLAMADGRNDLGMNIPHISHWGDLCSEWLRDLGF
ncbi:MAG: alpha/beta hydrolase [Lachnospiraceae bacterium]|nr:alpha/beta hydrolase [Lachnospiraceae bacterium]